MPQGQGSRKHGKGPAEAEIAVIYCYNWLLSILARFRPMQARRMAAA
ncbi:hypothetical protein SAMN05444170_2054 [Bradyrhizobium erythrophlei]|uniref:Uncharacterized protein n=1 Tax=Bradyrhizobium erythrophlei TaxID=1437360 RepID=A0A1M7TLF0_9BRAD|nr:hypothetical protein SAMN05444170_2054 [Bradyrhizobium erythrophlei]